MKMISRNFFSRITQTKGWQGKAKKIIAQLGKFNV